jgi:hypothetical protein
MIMYDEAPASAAPGAAATAAATASTRMVLSLLQALRQLTTRAEVHVEPCCAALLWVQLHLQQ